MPNPSITNTGFPPWKEGGSMMVQALGDAGLYGEEGQRKTSKLTRDIKNYLREAFQSWTGHPYDRKFFFAALAKRTMVPQAVITKFFYNDRRRNPQLYDDIKRHKLKRRSPSELDEDRALDHLHASQHDDDLLPPFSLRRRSGGDEEEEEGEEEEEEEREEENSIPHHDVAVMTMSEPPQAPRLQDMKEEEVMAVKLLLSIRSLLHRQHAAAEGATASEGEGRDATVEAPAAARGEGLSAGGYHHHYLPSSSSSTSSSSSSSFSSFSSSSQSPAFSFSGTATGSPWHSAAAQVLGRMASSTSAAQAHRGVGCIYL